MPPPCMPPKVSPLTPPTPFLAIPPAALCFTFALTRGREANHAYLYERLVGEADHEHSDSSGVHHLRRGDSRHAASVLRGTLGQKDHRPATVHSVASEAEPTQLPPRVRSLLSRHDQALAKRRTEYSEWLADTQRPDRHPTVSQAQ